MVITDSGDPADRVADFIPRTFLGRTDRGPVTCVDAYLQPWSGKFTEFLTSPLRQVWDTQMLIIGAHLPEGRHTELGAVRFGLGPSSWWGHLPDEESVSGEFGTLRCLRDSDGQVVFDIEPAKPLTLGNADRAIQSIITLVNLAVDERLIPTLVQIREIKGDGWVEVHTEDAGATNPAMRNSDFFLPPNSLSLERMARWLTSELTMDGLSTAVAEPISGAAMQVKTLTACSLVEGLHRRIYGGRLNYRKRAAALLEGAARVDGEIVAPIDDWPALVVTARNDLAHHNPITSLDLQIYNWMLVEPSVMWVLRVCLLSHAGFADEELCSALNGCQKYKFYRENLKMHLKERTEIEVWETARHA